MNYYDLLGVPFNATYDEIRSAYLNLSKKYHPDVNSANNATYLFTQIKEAYDTLSHPVLREEYNNKPGFTKRTFDMNQTTQTKPTDEYSVQKSYAIRYFFIAMMVIVSLIYYYYYLPNLAISIVRENYTNSYNYKSGPVELAREDPDVHTIYGWIAKNVEKSTFFVAYMVDDDDDKSNGYQMYTFEVDTTTKTMRQIGGNNILQKKYRELGFID